MYNYHLTFTYFDEEWDVDVIAFDENITYKGFLTFYIREGFRIVADLGKVENLKIKSYK